MLFGSLALLYIIVSFFAYYQEGTGANPFFILFAAAVIAGIIYAVSLIGRKYVLIKDDGVHLVHGNGDAIRFFEWEKVKTIGLSVNPSGNRISWGYMYFTTKKLKNDRVIIEYFEKPYVIMLKYSPQAAHCTLQHWDKEIKNLEAMRNWKRYINSLK